MPELRGNSEAGWAVWGGSNSGTGVAGTAGTGVGTFGESSSSYGVWGRSASVAGVVGDTTSTENAAVWGHNRGSGDGVLGSGGGANGAGVVGRATNGDGVFGFSSNGNGVRGMTGSTSGVGVVGIGQRAAVFDGNVSVLGTLTLATGDKQFKIDHPLDSKNRYLLHACVESSERKNVYDGVVQLDADGTASVDLPRWFEALNGDFRYQLTAVGGAAPNLHVAEEVSESRFRIGGGEGALKVCWQVTGSRKDAWAAANPFEVEEEKPPEDRGRYLEPSLYGAPEEQRVMRAPIEEEERLQQVMSQQPPESPQAPEITPGFAAPGFGHLEAESRRQIDELRGQIEELRQQR